MINPIDLTELFKDDNPQSMFPSLFLLMLCAFLMGTAFEPQEDLTEVKSSLSRFNDFIQNLDLMQEVPPNEL